MENNVLSLFGERDLSKQFSVVGQPDFLFLNQEHWFVPCVAYECEIVMVRQFQTELNCFESAVLHLLDLSHRDPKDLAEILCLEGEELIRLLLGDLQRMGMIEGKNKLTSKGKEEIARQKEKKQDSTQAYATLFRNTLTGTFLPYVPVELPTGGDEKKRIFYDAIHHGGRKEELSFYCGTVGNKQEIRGRILEGSGVEQPIQDYEIAQVLREFQKHSHGRTDQWEISADYLGKAMPYYPVHKPYYVHLQGGKTLGNAEQIVISDGFMANLGEMVAYIQEHQSHLLENLHSGAIVARRQEEEGIFYENESYPQLKGAWCSPLQPYDQSKDGEKALDSAMRQGIVAMYGELEWGFHYYFLQHPLPPTALEPYQTMTVAQRKEALEKILDHCKLKRGKVDLTSMFSAYPFRPQVEPVMTQLFPLFLIQQGETLEKMAKAMPHFYEALSYLHPMRNKAIHEGVGKLGLADYEAYQQMAQRMLDVLLPDWNRTRYVRKSINENNSDTNRRLLALERLHKEFGFAFVKTHLTEEMTETFILLSPEQRNPCSAMDYIKGLSLLLELSFTRAIEGKCRVPLEPVEQIRGCVLGELEISLPSTLTTVKPKALHQAMQGKAETLGAVCLAFLSLGEKKGVETLLKGNGLAVVNHIIQLRGHGNSQGASPLLLSQKELQGLRNAVVLVMKGMVGNVQEKEKE